jgi:uncharacterized damage-inducible protein DinB
MYTTIDEFAKDWEHESSATQKLLDQLTDASLSQEIVPNHRTLGRIAWHITTTIPEMMNQVGAGVTKLDKDAPLPKSADTIKHTYADVSKELLENIKKNWTDDTLKIVDTLYGSEKWEKGRTLRILVIHQAHHRGQLTVLMRQAGLKVPGVYGPSFEEWTTYGMNPPVI